MGAGRETGPFFMLTQRTQVCNNTGMANNGTPTDRQYAIDALISARSDIKDVIADLMTKADLANSPSAHRAAGKLHTLVSKICDDIDYLTND